MISFDSTAALHFLQNCNSLINLSEYYSGRLAAPRTVETFYTGHRSPSKNLISPRHVQSPSISRSHTMNLESLLRWIRRYPNDISFWLCFLVYVPRCAMQCLRNAVRRRYRYVSNTIAFLPGKHPLNKFAIKYIYGNRVCSL